MLAQTRLNLTNTKFEQTTGDTLNLSGNTIINAGGTLDVYSDIKISGNTFISAPQGCANHVRIGYAGTGGTFNSTGSYSDGSIAIGYRTRIIGTGVTASAIAIGDCSYAYNRDGFVSSSMAIGSRSVSSGGSTIAIGRCARAYSSSGGIAIGTFACASPYAGCGTGVENTIISPGSGYALGTKNVGIGSAARIRGEYNISIGSNSTVGSVSYNICNLIAIGRNAIVGESNNTISIGSQINYGFGNTTSSINLGHSLYFSGKEGINIGQCFRSYGSTYARNNILIGASGSTESAYLTPAGCQYLIGIGTSVCNWGNNSIGLGNTVLACTNAIAVGQGSNGTGTNSIGIGCLASASNTYAIAVGSAACSSGLRGVAIGRSANATQANGIAISTSACASGIDSISIGVSSDATSTDSIAIGSSSQATANCSIAIGNTSCVGGNLSTVIGGGGNTVTSTGTTLLGGVSRTISATTYNDHTLVENLGILTAPQVGASNDAYLVWDSVDGIVKQSSGITASGSSNYDVIQSIGSVLTSTDGQTANLEFKYQWEEPATGFLSVGQNLTYDKSNVNLDHTTIFGQDHILTGTGSTRWTNVFSEANTLCVTSSGRIHNAFVNGYQNSMCSLGSTNTESIFSGSIFGSQNLMSGGTVSALIAGQYNETKGNNLASTTVLGGWSCSSGKNAFVHGSPTNGNFANSAAGTPKIFACGFHAINMSSNSPAQTAGYGALATDSGIFAGRDHHIAATNSGATIIGGNTIRLTGSSYVDTTAVANLAIMSTPSTLTASTSYLVWDSSDKKVKTFTGATGGGGTPAGVNTNVQYNDSGSFGGSNNFTWDNTTRQLDINGDIALSGTSFLSAGNDLSSLSIGSGNTISSTNIVSIGQDITLSNSNNIGIGCDITSIQADNILIGNNPQTGIGGYNIVIGRSGLGFGSDTIVLGRSSSAASCAVAIGCDADAFASFAVGIGTRACAYSIDAISIGRDSFACAFETIAIGTRAYASAVSSCSLGIGYYATTLSNGSVSIGTRACSISSGATTIGNLTYTSGTSAIAIGNNAKVTGNTSIVIGRNITSNGFSSIGIGYGITNNSNRGIIIGCNTSLASTNCFNTNIGFCNNFNASTRCTIAIGHQITTCNSDGIVGIGNNVTANGISIGNGVRSYGFGVAIGNSTCVCNSFPTAVGVGAKAFGGWSTALGASSFVDGNTSCGAVAVGWSATASSQRSVAVGNRACVFTNSDRSVSIGYCATSSGNSSIAIGNNAIVTGGTYSIAIGYGTTNTASRSAAIGYALNSSADNALIFGRGDTITLKTENDIANSFAWAMNQAGICNTNGFLYPNKHIIGAQAVTTTTGLTNAATITLEDNILMYVQFTVIGRDVSGSTNRAVYEKNALVYRETGGSATIQGAVETLKSLETNSNWDATIAVVGNDVRFQVQGDTGETVHWNGYVELTKIR